MYASTLYPDYFTPQMRGVVRGVHTHTYSTRSIRSLVHTGAVAKGARADKHVHLSRVCLPLANARAAR